MPAKLHVTPVTPEIAPQVRALRVAAEQYCYVGDVEANLIEAEADPNSDAMAIVLDGRVVGFYRIDLAPCTLGRQQFGGTCAALRGMLVDRSLQGGGIGTRALIACCEDLQRRHPQLQLLALTVNCGNGCAIKAYRKAGFVDSGELYFGGRSGPQHLMLRRLHPAGMGKSAA